MKRIAVLFLMFLAARLFASDSSVVADLKELYDLERKPLPENMTQEQRKSRQEEIRNQTKPILDRELAKLAQGEITPLAKDILSTPEAAEKARIALKGQFATYSAETRKLVLDKAFNLTPNELRGSFLLSFIAAPPNKIPYEKAMFAGKEMQEWLVESINQRLPAGPFYFILTEESAEAVYATARASMQRFSRVYEHSSGNLFSLLSAAFLASHGDEDALNLLEFLLENRNIDYFLDREYVVPASAMSGNERLMNIVRDIIITDKSLKWIGEDTIPQEASFAHVAACAYSSSIEGFPKVTSFGYDEAEKKLVSEWLENHPIPKYKPEAAMGVFLESLLWKIVPTMLRAGWGEQAYSKTINKSPTIKQPNSKTSKSPWQEISLNIENYELHGRYAEALALCLRATDDSPEAQYMVGDYYYHGRRGIERDQAKGKQYYNLASAGLLPIAEQGDALAQYRLGRCLEFADGDLKTAEKWYIRSADGGNTKAMCRRALLELARNQAGKGSEYLARAAELGEPDAKAWQGAMLVEREEKQEAGVDLLYEAVSDGSAIAMARLSALYYQGKGGVERNIKVALMLMQEAVGKGFSDGIKPLEDIRKAYDAEKTQIGSRNKDDVKQSSSTSAETMPSPGDGFPGRLEKYDVTPELKRQLERFSLAAGWFRRDKSALDMLKPHELELLPANEIPYLLFTPKRGTKPVPMVIYFGGTGEHGTNLMAQFHQTTIFSKITSPEFQKDNPCYLFAPVVPKGTYLQCGRAWNPPMADLVCDAMYAVIRDSARPPVDTNRLYLTGLSYGGSVAYTFPFGYPGRFAASLPVAASASASSVPDGRQSSFWLLYNEQEYASEQARQTLADMARTINERGGEFRSSSFPDKGHNAWDKAWREDAVWQWMFSKTADGNPVAEAEGAAKPVVPRKSPGMFIENAVCSASKPGHDDGTGPERAADGLDATCYVSAEPFKRGDWWQIEFAEPVEGLITVKSGYRNGTGRATSASVETSADGMKWERRGRFMRSTGECSINQPTPVKHLRVVSESQGGETLVLREVEVAAPK